MPWRKDRPVAPGELEFQLGGQGSKHDDAWMQKRAERLERKHHAH